MVGDRVQVLVVLLLAFVVSAPAAAQVVQRPPRPYRGLFGGPPVDPNRTRQEVNVSASLLGSYDDNLVPANIDLGGLFEPRPEGYSGVGDARFRYWYGRQSNNLEVVAGGAVFTYQNLGLSPEYAADARATWSGTFGRRYVIRASQDFRRDPFFAIGASLPVFPGASEVLPPPGSSTTGFSVRHSRMMNSRVSLQRRFSGRDAIGVTYFYNDRKFEDGVGDGDTHVTAVDYDRGLGARSAIRASYRYSDGLNVNFGRDLPLDTHTATLGFTLDKPLSPSRRFYLSFGAGGAYSETLNQITGLPEDYWTPSGFASTRIDWARSWSLWADYTRRVQVIEGLTIEPYVTDTALVRLGGFVNRRLEMVLSAGFADGQIAPEGVSNFQSYSGGSQLRYLLSRCCSFMASHTFYAHRLTAGATVLDGFVRRINQNAVRVGLTIDLSLYGRYVDRIPQ